jgi:hypothetical protein
MYTKLKFARKLDSKQSKTVIVSKLIYYYVSLLLATWYGA